MATAAERRIRRLWRALAEVDGFMEGASIFSESDEERAYFVNGTQVANFEGTGLGLRLTRAVIREHRSELKAQPNVDLRRSGSDWIIVDVLTDADTELVLRLAPLVAQAHWPASGALKPPPEGAELARRRRFH